MSRSDGPSVIASKLDDKGRRVVVVIFGGRKHENKFDCEIAFQRQQWRQDAIHRLRIPGEESAHEALEELLQAAIDDADDQPSTSLWTPAVTTMATIAHATTDWLWPQHIPAGAISNLSGDPGLGKSQLTCDLGARISRGWPMPPDAAPDGTFTPRGVLFMNAEDDPARTLRPRLEAAGADLNRIHCLRTMRCSLEGEEERPITLPSDLPAIEEVIRKGDVALVVIDPFVAFLDGKLNINNDGDVRRCLGQVSALAESTGAAFLLVRHLNKKSGLSAVYCMYDRTAGSTIATRWTTAHDKNHLLRLRAYQNYSAFSGEYQLLGHTDDRTIRWFDGTICNPPV